MQRWFVRSIVTALTGAALLAPVAVQAAQRPARSASHSASTIVAGSLAPGHGLKPADKK